MNKLREAYKQAKASAALEGIDIEKDETPEHAALREKWLSGKITSEQYREELVKYYRAMAKEEPKEK
jgi:hypothetical protein